MADPQAEITKAIDAIRRAAKADRNISRSAVLEIEQQVALIQGVTRNPEVEREGAYLVARAFERYTDRNAKPAFILDANLHGAIGRFEYALRHLGFLPRDPGQSRPSDASRDGS